MLIDMHLHQDRHSFDSHVSLEDIIDEAKRKGLDGICITDHDDLGLREIVEQFYNDDIKIFVGVEILTTQGDILVIGLDKVPDKMLTPSELLELVHEQGAVAISAHPYRKNNRGLGDNIFAHHCDSALPLTAVEVLNGSTPEHLNLQAGMTAMEAGLGMTAGSDAHFKERVGLMATYFPYEINNERELIQAIKNRDSRPMYYENGEYHFFNIRSDEQTA
ncbi:MAG: PHP domain-containing protein [Peptostreptococcaceae bacterium]|nr:PHP domain-containing protein [Peptostreptococcaceae bacterium]